MVSWRKLQQHGETVLLWQAILQALEALHKAYEYAHNIGARELICDNYEYSSMVYAAIGDYAQAYKYLDKRYHLGKELQSSNKLRNIEQNSYKDTKTKICYWNAGTNLTR